MELRWYQQEAVAALLASVIESRENHPLAVIPTGAGKTLIICELINEYLSIDPTRIVLILSHVKEIVHQDYDALTEHFEGVPIGLYSAGLDSRTIERITVGGIQSVHNKSYKFKDFGLVIIDEAHLVQLAETGMYRKFLKRLNANYVGLTATPFRMNGGYLHEGPTRLFNKLVYDLSSADNFMRLIEDGYLCDLITKATLTKMDTDGIGKSMGEFNVDELAARFDNADANEAAVKEIIQFGKNYKKWLIFTIDIDHAEHITDLLNKSGIRACCVHSQMEDDRSGYIDEFKNGKYRAMVNVNVLTTGFNAPDIDLIAMLRPTASPVLHVQTIGRGMRTSQGKTHCLVLDFGGNTMRLGPINDIRIRSKKEKGQALTRECPECGVINLIQAAFCSVCGFVFERAPKEDKDRIERSASDVDVLKRKNIPLEHWADVRAIKYSIHQKPGVPSKLRVTYVCGVIEFSEWICADHPARTYPKARADNWIRYRWLGPEGKEPRDLASLYAAANSGMLRPASQIFVNVDGQYPEIKRVKFGIPEEKNQNLDLYFDKDDVPF